MFIHDDSLKFPKLRQVNLKSGRCYVAEEGQFKGQVLPSITRVLGKKAKPQLDEWKKRVGKEEAARVSARATIQGSSMHKLMECHLNNEDLPRFSPNVGELWQYLHKWLDGHITRVYAQEQDVASFKLRMAGRLDLLASVLDAIAVVDAKSASRPKRTEWVQDYFLQGTFYALAVYEATGKVVRKIIFPIVSPQGLQVFETTPAKHYDELRARCNDFYESYAKEKPVDIAAAPVV
jgi:hypothetical protein